MNTADLMTSKQIAQFLGVCQAHCTQRIIKRPDFPAPVINVSQRLKVFLEKGYIMNLNQNSQNSTPIRDAVQHDSVLRSVMDEVAKGNITATAPHQHMHRIWSLEEKAKLVDAMEYFFPKNS